MLGRQASGTAGAQKKHTVRINSQAKGQVTLLWICVCLRHRLTLLHSSPAGSMLHTLCYTIGPGAPTWRALKACAEARACATAVPLPAAVAWEKASEQGKQGSTAPFVIAQHSVKGTPCQDAGQACCQYACSAWLGNMASKRGGLFWLHMMQTKPLAAHDAQQSHSRARACPAAPPQLLPDLARATDTALAATAARGQLQLKSWASFLGLSSRPVTVPAGCLVGAWLGGC